MDSTICYLNTDLDLTSPDDLTALASVFESRGVFPLHVTRGEDGLSYATFEVLRQHSEPELDIVELVAVVESLGKPHRSAWRGCTRREFNIGYDCGAEPWAFNQGLSCGLLARLAAVGASLRWTLYPDRGPAKSSGKMMAGAKARRLVIEPWVPSYLAKQLGGLWGWFKKYARENLPDEELAPGEDGLPADSAPVLEKVKQVEQIRVVAANDIGKGHLSVKCAVRLEVTASLNDTQEQVVTIRPSWEMCLLVEPGAREVLEHSHGWESDYLPD